jgi:ariadne-1
MSEFEYDYEDDSLSDYSDQDGTTFKDEDSLKDLHAVPYKQHTTQQLLDLMAKQCREIAEVLGKNEDEVITLLQSYKWNAERLMEDYMDDPDGVSSKAGLSSAGGSAVHEAGLMTHPKGSFSCDICCEDKEESYQLRCGHYYCIDCYRRYIDERIAKGNVIKCPSCDLALTPADIDIIIGNNGSNKLLQNSMKEYVERHANYKWCPSPDCREIVEVLHTSDVTSLVEERKVPVVTCGAGHQFCFHCGYESHLPSPCYVTKSWIRKCKDDSETVKWITSNTKNCPKCDTAIEKNGGCNHMTCKKCAYEFCWICLGDWRKHSNQFYQCNRYHDLPPEKLKAAKDSQKLQEVANRSLKRYLHYYGFFNIHETSTRLDSQRCNVVESLVRALQEGAGISWIEAQFLVESANKLLCGRRILKWTYPFAFYCDQGAFLDLFETVQAGLSDAVEGLSKLFEIEDPQEIVAKKLDFLNASQLLIDRQKAMVLCANDAVTNGTLSSI